MSNSSPLEIYNRDITEYKVMVVPTGQAATMIGCRAQIKTGGGTHEQLSEAVKIGSPEAG